MRTSHQSKYQTITKAPLGKVWDALINPETVVQYFSVQIRKRIGMLEAKSYGLATMKEKLMKTRG